MQEGEKVVRGKSTKFTYCDRDLTKYMYSYIRYVIVGYKIDYLKLKQDPNNEKALHSKEDTEEFFENSEFLRAAHIDGQRILKCLKERIESGKSLSYFF